MIASRWPDIELWAVNYLRPLLPGVVVKNQHPDSAPPYKLVVVTAIYGQRVTAITQTVRLDIEVHVLKAGGVSDLVASRALADDVAFHLESAPRDANPIVYAEKDTGPNRVVTAIGDPEFHELSVNVEIHRLT